MKQTLPLAFVKDGKLHLTEPYEPENRITCEMVGEMSDGSKVWEDENGKQYARIKKFGKYFFITL